MDRDSVIQFANFSITTRDLFNDHFLRDPKLPNVISYFVEILLLLIGNVSCWLFLTTLRRSKCFHPNMNLLLGNFTFTLILLAISRYMITVPMIISYFVGYRVDTISWCRAGKTLHDGSIYFTAVDMIILVVERVIATSFVRVYERNTCMWLGIMLLIIQYSFGIIILIGNQTAATEITSQITPCRHEYLNKDIVNFLMIFIFASDIVSIGVFLLLLHLNKRRYTENNKGADKSYWLSERYQIVENVRSTRLLLPVIVGFLVISILAIFFLMFLFRAIARFTYTLANFDITWSLCGSSFDLLVAFYTICFPWLALNSHKKLRKNSLLIIRSLNNKLRVNSANVKPTEKRPKILDLNGKSLLPVDCTDETNIYFKNLYDSWNK